MDATTEHDVATRPLQLLGISGTEEHVYRALLKRHKASSAQVAGDLGISGQAAADSLEDIEALGLATHMPETPKAYVAVEPELAIDALIKQRQLSLEQARLAVPVLMDAFVQPAPGHGEAPVLELITNRAYLRAVVDQMFKSLRNEILLFQKLPILAPSMRRQTVLPPGVQARSISDHALVESSGTLAATLQDVALGEQARTVSTLPFKMMIVDRGIAIMTLDGQSPETASTLLIRGGALVEALCQLFEFVWAKATPVFASRDGKADANPYSAEHGMEFAKALIPLMAAGLNDKAIAQELHISASTLNRRIADLMRTQGVRTRFQLGMQLAKAVAEAARQPA